jgi:ATP-dependent exoDNAse (exonuclease V) beta subunit
MNRAASRELMARVADATLYYPQYRYKAWGYGEWIALEGLLEAARICENPRYQGFVEVSEAETRLLYVAMTRSRLAVHLPRDIQKRFGLRNTTAEILGFPRAERQQAASAEPSGAPSGASEAVSPYRSPRATDSREMAALKRLFR